MFHRLAASAAIVVASAAVVVVSSFLLTTKSSQADPGTRKLPALTVFLDPPTGLLFLKLLTGWKFIGRVDVPEDTVLAPGVVTSLMGWTAARKKPDS